MFVSRHAASVWSETVSAKPPSSQRPSRADHERTGGLCDGVRIADHAAGDGIEGDCMKTSV